MKLKGKTMIMAVVLMAVANLIGGVVENTPVQLDFRRPDIVPNPMELTYESSTAVRIDRNTEFVVTCPANCLSPADDNEVKPEEWIRTKVKDWFGVKGVKVTSVEGEGYKGSDEGYSLKASPGKIEIGAKTLCGIKYAMYSLRQSAERESTGIETKGYWLPALTIRDEPTMKFRGIHFCFFPECSLQLIERYIRVAAYYKFNYIVIENWGVFKSKKYPYLSVPEAQMTVKEARRLAAIAKDCGITLIPQVNIFGHASMGRVIGGKHATLDVRPERQPLFEPANGWNWCLSNPEAMKVLHGFIEELHEVFGNPPFFHIGCDEADPPTCPKCRAVKPYSKLVESHIVSVAELLRKRGARSMIWHDMLLEKGKWKPFYANGDADQAKMVDTLPKDILICDWFYGQPPANQKYPTLDYFKSKGFDVVTSPAYKSNKGIEAQAKYARSIGLPGVLQTVWARYRGIDFGIRMEVSSCAVWGHGRTLIGRHQGGPIFSTHWRQCGWDTGVEDYLETGLYSEQVTRDILDR